MQVCEKSFVLRLQSGSEHEVTDSFTSLCCRGFPLHLICGAQFFVRRPNTSFCFEHAMATTVDSVVDQEGILDRGGKPSRLLAVRVLMFRDQIILHRCRHKSATLLRKKEWMTRADMNCCVVPSSCVSVQLRQNCCAHICAWLKRKSEQAIVVFPRCLVQKRIVCFVLVHVGLACCLFIFMSIHLILQYENPEGILLNTIHKPEE